jgi:hypothetical protein
LENLDLGLELLCVFAIDRTVLPSHALGMDVLQAFLCQQKQGRDQHSRSAESFLGCRSFLPSWDHRAHEILDAGEQMIDRLQELAPLWLWKSGIPVTV